MFSLPSRIIIFSTLGFELREEGKLKRKREYSCSHRLFLFLKI